MDINNNKINYTKRYKEGLNWLNTNQKKAVEAVYGPVMVVAGPGTGKTQILALRTAYLLYEGICNPENILISTFTDAGVIALRERLAYFIGSDAYKITVSTIHSFAQDVIRNFPIKFIEYKAQEPIDEIGAIELIKEILFKAVDDKKIEKLTSSYDKEYYLRAIKSNISILKREGINSKKFDFGIKEQDNFYKEELESLKENKRIRDLAKRTEKDKKKYDSEINKLKELNYIYKKYQDELRKRGLYDFDDMIIYVLEVFKKDEELRSYYAEKYQFIMLDEFQDTNNAQNLIISKILEESIDAPNIFVVGDDDQSIYRFQGANIENIMKFAHSFKDVKTIVMEENYRSSQNILDTAQSLINNNTERLVNKLENLNKNLIASGLNKKFTNPVQFGITSNELTEKYSILQEIKNLRKNYKSNKDNKSNKDKIYSEIAIIVRSNQEVKDWSEYLQNNNIPVNSKSQRDTFNNSYVKLIIKFFRIIINPRGDERAMYDIIRSGISGVNGNDFLKISRFLFNKNYTRKDSLKIADILSNSNLLTNVIIPSERDLKDFGPEFYKWNNLDGIKDFWQNILDLQEILAKKSVSEFFDIFLKKFNLIEYIQKNEGFEVLEDIYDFFDFVKISNKNNTDLKLEDLLDRIDLYKKYNISRKRTQILEKLYGVNIITGHSSKGLEWDTVFIPGCYLGGWDNTRTRNLIKLPNNLFSEFQLDNNDKKEKSIEEARRLFFVAITRARKNLLLTLPSERNSSATVKSMFIEELAGNLEEIILKVPKDELQEEIVKLITHNIEIPNDSEFAYINNFFKNYKLSPSDLNLFLEDPREFLFRVILKYPFIPNEFTIFGNVYHRVLELFYLKYKKEDKIPESSYLTSTFKVLLSREILTHSEYEKLLEKGINGLEGWYKTYSSSASIPLDLEYNFRSKNVVFEGVPITGKIDKIDLLNSINSIKTGKAGGALFTEGVVLVDYKTGKPKTLNTIKGLTKKGNKNYFRQLLFYKLLAENDKDFSSKFIVDGLAIDFVEGKDGIYKYINIDHNPEDYEELKQEIIDSWKKMQDENFWREILSK